MGPAGKAVGEQTAPTPPIKLPQPDEILAIVFDLERRLTQDVSRGREELRLLFRDGRIDLVPQPGGFYVARSTLLLMQPPSEAASQGGRDAGCYTTLSCAGAIHALDTVVFLEFELSSRLSSVEAALLEMVVSRCLSGWT